MLDHSKAASRGGFIISLDLELMWGVRDITTLARYGPNILGVRQVVPRLLELFARHDLACTWATVGMLFFEERAALMAALPKLRPGYRDRRLSPYEDLHQLGESERDDPYHFGLSLVRQIAKAPRQEIATHTFSHYYCLEPGQTLEEFRADLAAAARAGAALGIRLESIVFPRNQVNPDYFAACREAGLIAYRGNERSVMYRPAGNDGQTWARRAGRLVDAYLDLTGPNGGRPRLEAGLVDIPSSRFLRPWSRGFAGLERLRLRRVLSAMRSAASRDELFHLWFHPHNFGVNQAENFAMMERIAEEAVRLRASHGWHSMTMAEAARGALAA